MPAGLGPGPENRPDAPPPEGFYDPKSRAFAPPAGGFIDLNSGVYVPPPPGSVFDPISQTYQAPTQMGSFDPSGGYVPPKGFRIDRQTGAFMTERPSEEKGQGKSGQTRPTKMEKLDL